MEISHLLDNNNTGSIGSPREGRQGDCLGLVMRRSGGLGQERPGFSHQALESATRRPESATTEAESATREPESATKEPESATREPESATTPPESKSEDSSAFRDQDLPDP